MSRKFFSPYFLVTWVALSIASGLFLLEGFRMVVVTTEIVILPKSELAMTAAGNAVALIRSESFAERVTQGLDPAMHAGDWSESVAVELLPASSTLTLSLAHPSRGEASRLMTGITKEFGAVLSQWYAIPETLDLRVIDGPRSALTVSSWPLFIGASLVLGFLVTTGFFLLLALTDRALRRSSRRERESASAVFSPETFRPSPAVPYWSEEYSTRPAPAEAEAPVVLPEAPLESMPSTEVSEATAETIPADGYTSLIDSHYGPETVALESVFEEDARLETEPPLTRGSRRSMATGPAPDNLPIIEPLSPLEGATARLVAADINATARIQSAQAEAELVQAIADEPVAAAPREPKTGEPTQEDYKRRLNELLSGRM